jgi:cation:H+ antiporter
MLNVLIYVLFVIGFFLLLKGADLLVSGSSSLAKKLKISDIIIGLTIVSLATSAPELFVNILSSLRGNAEIGIGNVFGSNIANILLILGISSIIYPLHVRRNTVLSEIPFSLAAVLLFGFIANTTIFSDIISDGFNQQNTLFISSYDGVILLAFFVLFLVYIIKITRENADNTQMNIILGKTEPETTEYNYEVLPTGRAILYMVLGIIGLSLGGQWVVDGALHLSADFGFSDSFIGLTIIAIGTSLPELITSATAAFKKKADIAIGNVVGSNIFNILWVLGISAVIKPLPFEIISNIDIMIIIFSSALLIFVIAIGKKYVIERWNGVLFLLFYIAYIVFLFFREQ